MPKEITHILLAEKAADLSDKHRSNRYDRASELLKKHANAFRFGSVSPDIFFYDIPFVFDNKSIPRGLPFGAALHGGEGEDTMAHIAAMLRILEEPSVQKAGLGRTLDTDQRDMLFAFCTGYLTHIALDTVFHPLVYYYSGNYYHNVKFEKRLVETRHRVIESVLDLLVLEKNNMTLNDFSSYKKIRLGRNSQLILGFYALSVRMAFGAGEKPHENEHSSLIPELIYNDPVFKTFKRGYRKLILASRTLNKQLLRKVALKVNKRKNDLLSEHTSVMYPAVSFSDYLKNYSSPVNIRQIGHYIDPVTGERIRISENRLTGRCLARARRFIRTAYLVYTSEMSLAESRRILRPYSLNNGHIEMPVTEMKYFNPIDVNGNFTFNSYHPELHIQTAES